MDVGIDIELTNRFKGKPEKFYSEIFCPEEILYANKFQKPYEHFCAFWCVKEAVVKAFSNLTLPFDKICVLHDIHGKPYIKMTPEIEKELKAKKLSEIKISISHAGEYSTAICILN